MDLVYKNEKALFTWMLCISVPIWALLIVGTLGTALLYLLLFFIAYCFAQSALVSHLQGTAVRITEQQYPDLKARVDACSRRLELEPAPEAYLLQMGGLLNAFATRFLGRNYIVLYADVVDALDDRPHQAQSLALVGAAGAGRHPAAAGRGLCAGARVHLRPPRLSRLRRSEKRPDRTGGAGGGRQALAPDQHRQLRGAGPASVRVLDVVP
jgi:hypothetical protein